MVLNERDQFSRKAQKLKTDNENKVSVLLAIKLQLVFDGAMDNPDEVDVPTEKKHQESFSL